MAGGGTGGHLYPGLAVAEALQRQAGGEKPEIVWAATPRAVDQRLLSGFGERYIRQAVKPLMMSPGKWWGFGRAWRETCGYWAEYFEKHAVDCVVALGGYAAGPAAYVAAKRAIPVILLNPDALPGRANRFLFKRADVIVTQWPMDAGDAGGGGVDFEAGAALGVSDPAGIVWAEPGRGGDPAGSGCGQEDAGHYGGESGGEDD